MSVADTFTGFPPAGIAFLAGLAADNARTYFNAHRGTYANDVAAPLRALVTDVGERLRDQAVPDLCFEPSTGKSLFRINRDTRFSADKTPYHPWVDAIWWARPGDARHAPAFILRLSAGYLIAGAGIMGLRDTGLGRYRAAVAGDSSGHGITAWLTASSRSLPSHRRAGTLQASPSRPCPAGMTDRVGRLDWTTVVLIRCTAPDIYTIADHGFYLSPPRPRCPRP